MSNQTIAFAILLSIYFIEILCLLVFIVYSKKTWIFMTAVAKYTVVYDGRIYKIYRVNLSDPSVAILKENWKDYRITGIFKKTWRKISRLVLFVRFYYDPFFFSQLLTHMVVNLFLNGL